GLGSTEGSGGQGGATTGGGAGVMAVEVSGKVEAFATVAFDIQDVKLYTGPIKVIAPGAATKTVEADAAGGAFDLTGAAAGDQWVLAQDPSGPSNGPFATYSYQVLDGQSIVVPVVPFDLLDAVATQLGGVGLTPGRAHMILVIENAAHQPVS